MSRNVRVHMVLEAICVEDEGTSHTDFGLPIFSG
jgi:hypothetical protein